MISQETSRFRLGSRRCYQFPLERPNGYHRDEHKSLKREDIRYLRNIRIYILG